MNLGCILYVARVSRTGLTKARTGELHQQLQRNFAGKELNLIAHSMGGLNNRYLLSHIQPSEYRVCSLTAICTPHRGSLFMYQCRDYLGPGASSLLSQRAAEAREGKDRRCNGNHPCNVTFHFGSFTGYTPFRKGDLPKSFTKRR